jgi:hypothetical protein
MAPASPLRARAMSRISSCPEPESVGLSRLTCLPPPPYHALSTPSEGDEPVADTLQAQNTINEFLIRRIIHDLRLAAWVTQRIT